LHLCSHALEQGLPAHSKGHADPASGRRKKTANPKVGGLASQW